MNNQIVGSVSEKVYQILGIAFAAPSNEKGGYNANGKKMDINLKILGEKLLSLHFIAGEKKEIEDMLILMLSLSQKEVRALEQYFNANEFDEQLFRNVRETINNAKNDIESLKILFKKVNKLFPMLGDAASKRIRITEKGIISIRELFTV